MTVRIMNDAGECVSTADSDAEAVRWWQENGRSGDYIEETDELVSEVAAQLGLDGERLPGDD